MAASAPHQQSEHEADGRTRKAWDVYRTSLHDLEGRDYEEAERASWERLQRALLDIAADSTQ